MNSEIERKYLVRGKFKDLAKSSHTIRQGYLCTDPERTIRVRIIDKKAMLTIKGKQEGIKRFEWEKEIDFNDAGELLKLCTGNIIEKTRYLVPYEKWTIEVDVFSGINSGLILAEIELEDENEKPDTPDWIGKEVSGDIKYNNSYLSNKPFTTW